VPDGVEPFSCDCSPGFFVSAVVEVSVGTEVEAAGGGASFFWGTVAAGGFAADASGFVSELCGVLAPG
jgi:hypothetical protein